MMKPGKENQYRLIIIVIVLLLCIMGFIVFLGYKMEKPLKVGVILSGETDDMGWNGMHYQGVLDACDKLELKLLVKENIPEGTEDCAQAIRELVAEGAEMIILTSYAYPSEVREVIEQYPNIAFYGISSEYYADNMTSYFGRMYQARYLTGIIAGMKTENNIIGYVAAMPNDEVNRGINAFTLGVQRVNTQASVVVEWTNTWEDAEKEQTATRKLIQDENADVITYHQNQPYVAKLADEMGIYSIGYHENTEGLSEKYLTAAIWDWKQLYYEILREFTQGKANSVKRHWFTIDTGVVKLGEFSTEVDNTIVETVEQAKEQMRMGKDVFSGVIYDNHGKQRCAEEEIISDENLLENMDWYVAGVKLNEE